MQDAHSFDFGLCDDPKCKAIHFQLYMKGDEEPFARMNITSTDAPKIAERIKDFAYQVAVGKKESPAKD